MALSRMIPFFKFFFGMGLRYGLLSNLFHLSTLLFCIFHIGTII